MNLLTAAKNAAALTAASMLAKAITGVVSIFLTRYLGPGAYGSYSIALTYTGTFVIFAELGLSQLMVQEGSRDKTVLPLYFGNALATKAILVFCAYLLMLFFMPEAYSPVVRTLVLICGLGAALNAIAQTVYNYYQSVEQMAKAAGFQFLTAILISSFSVVVILAALTVEIVVTAQLVVYAGILVLLYLALRGQIRPQIQWGLLPQMVVHGLPFGIHRIFYYVYLQMSILLLSFAGADDYEVGIYAAPYRLIQMLLFLPSTLTSAIYPILYQQGLDDREAHRRTTEKIFKVLVGVGLPGSVLLCVLAGPFIHWLFGTAYNDSVPVMIAVSWLLALECLSFSLGDVLTTTNRQTLRTIIQGCALALLFVFMPLGYEKYGLLGIAVVVVLVETLIFLCYYVIVNTRVYTLHIWRQLPVIAGAALVMAALAWLLRGWQPLLASAVAGGVYLGILAAADADFRLLCGVVTRRFRRSGS